MKAAPAPLPLARKHELVVQELPDELLVYDLKRDKAHCLNKTAAFVLNNCDGNTTIPRITALLEREIGAPVEADVVRLALQQLAKFNLLDGAPTFGSNHRISRRDLVRRIGIAAVLLPAIISISAPTAVSAATCREDGATCSTGTECCSGCCSEDVGGTTCQPSFVCNPR